MAQHMQTNKMTKGQGFYKQQGHWQPLCKVCAPPWSYVLGIKGEEEGGEGGSWMGWNRWINYYKYMWQVVKSQVSAGTQTQGL